MNIDRLISDEIEDEGIAACIQAARNQYENENDSFTNNIIPPDYHVLFILAKSILANGITYTTTSTMESIFYEAVDNFQGSVEAFTNHNVHIVPTIKEISETVCTWGSLHYLVYENVHELLKKFSSVGLYDAVIVVTATTSTSTAVTTLGTFQYENIMHGFTHVKIMDSDADKVRKGYSNDYPHLLTTNYFIHEWMHQLEGYNNRLVDDFPNAHGYQDPSSYGYSWDQHVFDNTTYYEHIIEPYYSSFYRAFLAAEITHTVGSDSRRIGMFPLFWKITPRKFVIGRYLVKNTSGEYIFNNNGLIDYSTLFTNEMKYIWNIYYSMSLDSGGIIIRNFSDYDVTLNSSFSSLVCTRVGPYDEGEYCLVNVTLGNTLLGYSTDYSLSMVYYRSNTMQTFNLEYYSELYFTLMPAALSGKYLDLNNNNDIEDNTVGLFGWSSNPTAQTWQYRFDGSFYKIMPKKSPTRSLSFHNGALHITASSNIQNWRPELFSNGKFIWNGSYKLKTEDGKYLTYSGNTLKIASSGTAWEFTALGDNYYSISVQNGSSTYCFDVLNAYDIEGNTVQVQNPTGYVNAQSWKLMLRNDGKIIIVPMLSLTRGIKSTTTGSTLSTSPTMFYLVSV